MAGNINAIGLIASVAMTAALLIFARMRPLPKLFAAAELKFEFGPELMRGLMQDV